MRDPRARTRLESRARRRRRRRRRRCGCGCGCRPRRAEQVDRVGCSHRRVVRLIAWGREARQSTASRNGSVADTPAGSLTVAPAAAGPGRRAADRPSRASTRPGASSRSASTSACAGSAGEVAHLARVHEQVVELDARARRLAPAGRDEQVLGGRVVDVRQHRLEAVAEVADELVAAGADRALRVVGGVVGQLGEQLVADLARPRGARAGAATRPCSPSGSGAPASSHSVG